ncbi:MAG TPA: hypothetical protein VHO46_09235 [Bacteroidales bacterium]|nr:hypothetical protein [Bacteroidales bacterium]
MKKEEIDRLLARYYDGTGTEEEERILKSFFTGNDVPEGYDAEKALFDYFRYTSEARVPSAGLDARILSSLDVYEQESPGKSRKLILLLSGVAASIVILVGSWFFFNNNTEKDTFDDPEIAYAETMKILYDVSARMNKETVRLEQVSKLNVKNIQGIEVLSRSRKTLEKNLTNLEYLDKVIEISNISEK